MERVQNNDWLVVTGAFKGTSKSVFKERSYQELGSVSLKDRRRDRKQCLYLQNCESTCG